MNDYRQLLVHLDAGARNAPRLRAARSIASDNGAEVAACYAVSSSYLDAAYPAEFAPAVIEALDALDQDRIDSARNAFDLEMREPGPAATWSQLCGLGAAGAFMHQALYADLIVLGQHDPDRASGAPADFNELVIMGSGRPALVMPYTGWAGAVGRIVAIAWKPTPQAARAVAAALPLLQRARQVHVLQWSGVPEEEGVTGHRLDLEGYLRVHGVEATWHEGGAEPSAIGELVLSGAFDVDADLLVMGCYGHSRAREFVMGGMSRTILRSMTLPVLMAH